MRFEIFKRDKFTCRYCGAKAPDALLEIDHVVPVKANGETIISNLITSCKRCNRGKSAKLLDDASRLQIKRQELETKQEEINQLKELIKWEREMQDTSQDKNKLIIELIESFANTKLTEYGKDNVLKAFNKYGLETCKKYILKYLEREHRNLRYPNSQEFSDYIRLNEIPCTPTTRLNYLIGIMKNMGFNFGRIEIKKKMIIEYFKYINEVNPESQIKIIENQINAIKSMQSRKNYLTASEKDTFTNTIF